MRFTRTQIQAAINAAKSKITAKQLFTSHGYLLTCTDIVAGVSKAKACSFKVRLEWGNKDGVVAYADSAGNVYLNLNNVFVKSGFTIREHHHMNVALLLHECGHKLWTDFVYEQRMVSKIQATHVVQYAPEVTKDLKAHPAWSNPTIAILQRLQNCIEDGYIELRLVKEFPGYGKYLETQREIQLKDSPAVEKLIQEKAPKSGALESLLLTYALYGVVKMEDETSAKETDLYKTFEPLIPVIEEARHAGSYEARWAAAEKVLESFWKTIKDLLNQNNAPKTQNNQGDSGSSGSGNSNGQSSSGSSSDDSDTNRGNQSSKPEQSEDNTNSNSGSSNTSETDADEDEEANSQTSAEGAETTQQMETILSSMGEEASEANEQDTNASGGRHTNRAADSSENEVSESIQQSAGNDNDYELEKAENELAEREAEDELAQINNMISDKTLHEVNLPSLHNGVRLITQNTKGVSSDYEKLIESIKPVYKRLTRDFVRKIQERAEYEKEDGLFSGQRVSHPYRADMRRMSKKTIPAEEFSLAVCVLIDLSGSMGGYHQCYPDGVAPKTNASRKAAMMLEMFCEELNIPIAIYGHNAYYPKAYLYRFRDYDNFHDKHVCERLSNMPAYVGNRNRDSHPLRIASEELAKRPEEHRLMIVISDGAPADNSYNYYNAKADIKDILTKYKGIRYLTTAIGNCEDEVRPLYQDGMSIKTAAQFIAIDNLDTMSKKLLEVLKKEIDG